MAEPKCIDIHSHLGWAHEDIREDEGVEHEADPALLGTLAENGVDVIVLSTIADRAITRWGKDGRAGEPGAMAYNARDPRPGECWNDNLLQLRRLETLIDKYGLARIL